jgi:hypothetical protein
VTPLRNNTRFFAILQFSDIGFTRRITVVSLIVTSIRSIETVTIHNSPLNHVAHLPELGCQSIPELSYPALAKTRHFVSVNRRSEGVLMRRKTASTSGLTFLFFLVLTRITSAGTVVINYTDRGWYEVTGIHYPNDRNYYAGDDRGYPDGLDDYRNFFVFDMSMITQPIESAKLALFVPPSASSYGGPGYFSPDPSENYELHDVVTPITALMAGTGGVAAHTDLGSGVVYGSRTMTRADDGSVIEIPLNSSAIAAMNSTHGLFGIGGSITTLDESPNFEGTFGGTGGENAIEATELRLTLVPEPSTFLLLGIGAISLLGYRKAKVLL